MKYESGEFIPLDYKNLRIDYAYEENPFYDSPGDFSVDYHVPEFTYWADMIRVAEEIYEWEDRSDNIPKEYEDKEYDYIESNFEELVNKYRQKLMDYFEDEAADVLLDLYLYERIRDEAITDGENYYPPNFKPAKGKTYSYYLEGYGGAFDIDDDQYFTKEELIEFADEIIEKIEDHYRELDPHFFITDLYMDEDKNVLHLEIEDDNLGTVFIDKKIDYRKVKTPYQIRNYTKEILDKFIKQIDSLKEALSPANYSPKQTGIAYKVFKVKNGKLYPPMVSNKNNEPTPVGVWLDAEEGGVCRII